MDWKDNLQKRILIDNGSNQIRFGNCDLSQPSQIIQNLLAIDKKSGNLLWGDNLQNTLLETNLNYIKPQTRGVTVDWDNQIHLWEQLLTNYDLRDIQQSCLIQSFHPGMPEKVRLRMFEVAFEYFQFDAFFPALSENMVRECFMNSPSTQNNQISSQFQLVVETSHSATYIVPFFDGQPINYAITRLDVGGKLLTSYFKDLISLRQLDLKNELRLTQQIKEEVCFISQQFKQDMKLQRGSNRKFFVLPDYDTNKKGFASDVFDENTYDQFLELDKERFQVPEVLFNPSDIGLFQNGLSQSVLDTVNKINPDIKDYFLENIILSGGNAKMPGLADRLQKNIREHTPQHINVNVSTVQEEQPVFQGMLDFCSEVDFITTVIRKQDYRENGFNYLQKLYFC